MSTKHSLTQETPMKEKESDGPSGNSESGIPIEPPSSDLHWDDELERSPNPGSSRGGSLDRSSYEIYGDERGGQKPTRP